MATVRRSKKRGGATPDDRNALIQVAVEHQVETLQRLSAASQKRALAIARSVLRRYAAELKRLEVGSWGYTARAAVFRQVRAMVLQLVAQQQAALGQHLGTTARTSAKSLARFLKAMDKLHLGVVRPLRYEVFEWIEQNAQAIAKVRLREYPRSFARYGAAAVQAIENEIGAAVAFGDPWNKVRPYVWDIVRSVVADKQWMVDRILRTETSAAWHGMQLEAMVHEDVDPSDRLMKRLVATFDFRTGKDSVLLHGQVRPVREKFYDAFHGKYYDAPPNRPNDREVMIPWRASYGRAYEGGVSQFVADTAAVDPHGGIPDLSGKGQATHRARARFERLQAKAGEPLPVSEPKLAKVMVDIDRMRASIRRTRARLDRLPPGHPGRADLARDLRIYRNRLRRLVVDRDRLRAAYERRVRDRVESVSLARA